MQYKLILSTIILLTFTQVLLSKYVLKQEIENSTSSRRIYEIEYQGVESYILAENSPIIKSLRLEIRQDKNNVLDIRLVDEALQQYQMPLDQEPFSKIFRDVESPVELTDPLYDVIINNDPLEIRVLRKSTNEVIFNATEIEFSTYYLAFKTQIPTQYFFGLGERNQKGFRFRQGTYTLMAKDAPKLIDDGHKPGGKGVYSSQPVYLMKEKSKNFHVFFYKSASPMDVIYEESQLKFITIGGVMHWKFFFGDKDPETAVKSYHDYLGGGFSVPPFWTLGFHQSKWTYRSAQVLIEVIKEYKNNDIPIDDLDYMNDKQIFSVNSLYSPAEYKMIQKELGVKYVPLLDVAVGVKYGDSDLGFAEGCEKDIFLRSPETGRRFKGYVWPGPSYFPDFFHPNISLYWDKMLNHLHDQVQFDGLWCDMNEPSNFCVGECDWQNGVLHDDVNEDYIVPKINFPYLPGGKNLENGTISSNIKHFNGAIHNDVHNLYGFMNTWVTYKSQKKLGKVQPYILSRSTFPGSGTICQHWFGDNAATWEFLYLSVGQIFQFNIFGMPMVGADVCGFMGDTEEQLCARWTQLGALYPFFRNHNDDRSMEQEFYNLGPIVLKSAQKNVKLRYSLLKWYYMLYFKGERKGTIYRPIFFVYPDDQSCYNDDVLDTQIMLGQDLMTTPIMDKDLTLRNAYFPLDTWFELLSGLNIQRSNEEPRYHLVYCTLDDYVPLYIRGGSIVFQQNIHSVLNTIDLKNQYNLIVALDMDENGKTEQVALGNILDLDDYLNQTEVVESCIENKCLLEASLQVYDELLFKIQDSKGKAPLNPIKVMQIMIYGLPYTDKDITCLDSLDKKIKCLLVSTNYYYNSYVQFDIVDGIEFGGAGGNKMLKIKFAE